MLERRRAFDDAFAEEARSGTLSSLAVRDRSLARAIAAMALRRKGQTDAIFERFLERPLKGKAGPLQAIARTALAEILFMDAPGPAVVNLAVHQARDDRRTARFAGLLNAILRRAVKEGPALAASQDAAALNAPAWLRESWAAAHGAETARRLAESSLGEAALDLTVKSDAGGWAARLGGVALPGGTVRLDQGGRIETLDGFEDGAWWVQDAAAALPARLLGDVAGKRIADLCAAPGGKTAQLAQAGARVTAIDISANRLRRLRDNLGRLSLQAEIVESDLLAYEASEPFDAVLLDAPCSATGTIRRHPDIPHLKSADDVSRLAALQERLLAKAAALVRPGGRLIYCTCSLQPEEGEAQIARFLESGADAAIDRPGADEAGGLAATVSEQGCLRSWPYPRDGAYAGDGFFIARLKIGALAV